MRVARACEGIVNRVAKIPLNIICSISFEPNDIIAHFGNNRTTMCFNYAHLLAISPVSHWRPSLPHIMSALLLMDITAKWSVITKKDIQFYDSIGIRFRRLYLKKRERSSFCLHNKWPFDRTARLLPTNKLSIALVNSSIWSSFSLPIRIADLL